VSARDRNDRTKTFNIREQGAAESNERIIFLRYDMGYYPGKTRKLVSRMSTVTRDTCDRDIPSLVCGRREERLQDSAVIDPAVKEGIKGSVQSPGKSGSSPASTTAEIRRKPRVFPVSR